MWRALCAAESPLSARGPAVEAALAASAPTASAPAPGVAAALPMSSMLSITAPLSATTTVLNDFQEEPMAASVSTTAPRTAAVYNDFQQRNQQGPGQGGPGQGGPGQNGPQQPPQGGPQQPPMPLPGGPFGPFDDSVSSSCCLPVPGLVPVAIAVLLTLGALLVCEFARWQDLLFFPQMCLDHHLHRS